MFLKNNEAFKNNRFEKVIQGIKFKKTVVDGILTQPSVIILKHKLQKAAKNKQN